MRSALLEGQLTASADGALLAPLMGDFTSRRRQLDLF